MAAREREYDDDEDRPRRRRRPSDEFEEGEPPPRRPRDEFEEDDRPARRRRSREDDDEYEDEYEERPRRRRRRRDVEEEYAGFWVRFVAVLIDGILLNIVFFPIQLALGISPTNPNLNMGAFSVFWVVQVLCTWLYDAGLTSSTWQATLGKKAMRLKVTDLDGRPIDFARATGRYFAKIVSAIPCGIGFFMVGFTERKQGLHDMIAGTLVVRDDR